MNIEWNPSWIIDGWQHPVNFLGNYRPECRATMDRAIAQTGVPIHIQNGPGGKYADQNDPAMFSLWFDGEPCDLSDFWRVYRELRGE